MVGVKKLISEENNIQVRGFIQNIHSMISSMDEDEKDARPNYSFTF